MNSDSQKSSYSLPSVPLTMGGASVPFVTGGASVMLLTGVDGPGVEEGTPGVARPHVTRAG